MKYSEAKQGRIFVIRLEDGDIVHQEIEKFALEKGIKSAALIILGGADKDSKLVVGPEQRLAKPIIPQEFILENAHEVSGTGTIFPDESGKPVLHMHLACGRNESTITGCVRHGVKVWLLMEAVLIELVDSTALRVFEKDINYKTLQP